MNRKIKEYEDKDLSFLLRISEEEIQKSHTFLSQKELRKFKDDTKKELCERQNTEYTIKVWVIYKDDKIVGFTSVREFSTETKIVSIYVLEAYQKKGYGTELFNQVFSECKPPYRLAVFKENQNAYNFYINLGFKLQKEDIQDNHKYCVMIKYDDNVKR
ncbi:GNAT family N-acetyltransferase [Nostoc sp. MG11]|uniref:GNAT family N-acetyltransferase n=1 Tax=Nostoc sp. MG11 TaxID=2721166 RepID=UPI00186600E1|nr:GNAT family N-acetyltransferase [Nostoc sp. MG11]